MICRIARLLSMPDHELGVRKAGRDASKVPNLGSSGFRVGGDFREKLLRLTKGGEAGRPG